MLPELQRGMGVWSCWVTSLLVLASQKNTNGGAEQPPKIKASDSKRNTCASEDRSRVETSR